MVRPIDERMKKRINEWFQRDYRETFMERIRLIFEAEELFKDEGNSVRYGHTLEHVLRHITAVPGVGTIV